ncbi:hypothetical protein ABLT60_00315 [Acinetobacter ursingii]|uniref:hypothetical protein n=1 Tax=Acinetobacter ursingii TaxID=108980 RepID=UPI0032B31306
MAYLLLLFILILTFFLYSSGLYGDYVFDDPVNILENTKIAITSLSYSDLKKAFFSGDAGPLGRPISMLSFALNHYFTGFNPFYFKLTNIFIHLVNGILVYIISLKIFNWLSFEEPSIKNKTAYMAVAVASIWLVHPINLTSILYVVQRMTSLSTLFGLLAILIYCSWRTEVFSISSALTKWLGIVLALLASLFSKESGLLFVGLIYWIELLIFQGKNINHKNIYWGKYKVVQYLWFGLGGILLLLIYVSFPYVFSQPAGNRDFSTIERLLTETRVVFYYLKLIFFPLLSDLSLYHDDFTISSSLMQPISTLFSLLGLLAITLLCVFFVKKYPLMLFAWGWYLISQLMESTFISLELVHEHRNYFGIIGFIFAIVFFLNKVSSKKIKFAIYIFGVVYFSNLALTTWQRANLWSNLVDQALYEATMHPKSDRANYQMARVLMQLMQTDSINKKYYSEQAWIYLKKAENSYNSGNGAWFAELHLLMYLNQTVPNKTIDTLVLNLKQKPFYNSNLSFLNALVDCQIKSFCHLDHNQAVRIIAAGLDNSKIAPETKAEIYKLLAQYFVSVGRDFQKGEEFMLESLKLKKNTDGYLIFAQIYRLDNKLILAQQQLNLAKELDRKCIWLKEIAIEQRNIDHAKSKRRE